MKYYKQNFTSISFLIKHFRYKLAWFDYVFVHIDIYIIFIGCLILINYETADKIYIIFEIVR